MMELLSRGLRPDALFCATDLLAIGAMHAAHASGLRIPDDLAVVGFDDLEEGRFFIPSLSSIAPDKALIARTAVELILGQRDHARGDVVLPFSFAARQSTVG
jgi:DNA-binding LacI/PurR family transcriptional regulator